MPNASSSRLLPLDSWRLLRKLVGSRAFSLLFSLRERLQFRKRFEELSAVGLHQPASNHRMPVRRLELPEPTESTLHEVVQVWKQLNVDKIDVGYAKTYASIVDALVSNGQSALSVLEIGVHGGASLRGWRAIFRDAFVIGLDIDESTMFSERGIETFVADQLSMQSLGLVAERLNQGFDLIVDDGWHQPQANINSLCVFLNRLNPGGFYVVEDVHRPEYLPFWSRVISGLPADFAGTVRPCGTHGILAHPSLGQVSLIVFQRQ